MRLLFAFLILLAGNVSAQQSHDSSVATAAATLRPGQTIRVGLVRARWVGEFQRVGGDTLFFGTANDHPMGIRFSAVDSLWRQRTVRLPGTVIGAFIGAAGGAAIYAGKKRRPFTLGTVAGGLLGALAGNLIGSTSRRWQRVFP